MDAKKLPTKKINVIITLKEEDRAIIKELAQEENRSVKNWLESQINKTIYKARKKQNNKLIGNKWTTEEAINIAQTKWIKDN